MSHLQTRLNCVDITFIYRQCKFTSQLRGSRGQLRLVAFNLQPNFAYYNNWLTTHFAWIFQHFVVQFPKLLPLRYGGIIKHISVKNMTKIKRLTLGSSDEHSIGFWRLSQPPPNTEIVQIRLLTNNAIISVIKQNQSIAYPGMMYERYIFNVASKWNIK